jgi:hypothetical protein
MYAGGIAAFGRRFRPIRRGTGASAARSPADGFDGVAALQQRMQLKENLAALGELSAGISMSKNALATISGYAHDSESSRGRGLCGRILRQTRDITHVVAEFRKHARAAGNTDATVTLQTVVERVVMEVGEAFPGESSLRRYAGDGRRRRT